jgi:hypothetical protein
MNFGYNKVRPNFCYNIVWAGMKEKALACNPVPGQVVIDL